MNQDMDAIYILSPQPHIVDCLKADFERRRYRRAFLVWITVVDTQVRRRLDAIPDIKRWIASKELWLTWWLCLLNVDLRS